MQCWLRVYKILAMNGVAVNSNMEFSGHKVRKTFTAAAAGSEKNLLLPQFIFVSLLATVEKIRYNKKCNTDRSCPCENDIAGSIQKKKWGTAMKKIGKVIMIASTVMLAALAGVMVYMNRVKEQRDAGIQQEEHRELDMVLDDVEQIEFDEDDEITPLYLSGKKKNVMTFEERPLSEVYTAAHTKKIDKELLIEKKRGSRRMDNAVFAWNPYGTQPMSLYVYFPTRSDNYLGYTVSVDSKEIPDFTRVLNNHNEGNLTQVQEYSIIGLIPGRKNYITFRLYRPDGSIQKEMVYSLDVPEAPSGIDTRLSLTKGYNQTLLGSGLYLVYGNKGKGQKKPYLLFYDNSGYLRSCIPLQSDAAQNVEVLDGCLFFPCSQNQFALMSASGQIKKIYRLDGYQLYGGFSYDGSKHIYALADRKGDKSSVHDKIIQLELKSGNVTKMIDMEDYLKAAKKKAKRNWKKKTGLNWIDLNSIQCKDRSTLILSARELSSVIILKRVEKAKPVLKSIIGEDVLWHGTGLKKKIAKKAGSFTAQFGQNSVTYGNSGAYEDVTPEYDADGNLIEPEGGMENVQYYLYLFNNNYGDSKTLPSIKYASFGAGTKKKQGKYSYYYQYLFDETENVYQLKGKMELPFSAKDGSIQVYQGNILASSPGHKVFWEYTPDGKMLHTYRAGFGFDKVEKWDFKDYWFY